MLQRILERIRSLNALRFALLLVPATIVYYWFVRVFQDSLHLWNPDIDDALPGYPVVPEPYEIPLYLAGYVVIPMVALVLYFFVSSLVSLRGAKGALSGGQSPSNLNIDERKNQIASQSLAMTTRKSFGRLRMTELVIGVTILLCIGIVGFYFLRPQLFSFVIDYFERQSVWHLIWLLFTKRIYVVKISFALALLAGVIGLLLKPFRVDWFRAVEASKTLKRFLPFAVVLLAVLVFHPNFPSQEGFTNFIVSPAHELLNGKPLLYETSSVYGIVNIYFTALLFKLGLPVSYQAFSVVLMITFFLFFVTLYLVLKHWFGSRLFSLLGTWWAFVVGFFLLSDPYITAYDFPGQGAFRQGMYVFVAFLIVQWFRTNRSWLKQFALGLSGLLVFWNIDTGIYIALATFATFAIMEVIHYEQPLLERLKRVVVLGCNHAAYVLLVFGIIHFVNYAVYGSFPHWGLELADISTFNSGYGKLPLPAFGLFELHIAVYVGYLVWMCSRLVRRLSLHPLVVFFTVYGMFSFQYYIGNSAWSYLNFISIPMLVLVVYAIKTYALDHEVVRVPGRVVNAVVLGFTMFMIVLTLAKIPTVLAYRDYTSITLEYRESEYDRALSEDAEYIKQQFPETRIAMFHFYDGTLLTRSGKINAFYLQNNDERLYSLYDDMLIVFKRQLRGLKNQLDEMKPEYVFLTNTPDARQVEFEDYVKQSYALDTQLRTLNIYKRNQEKQ